MKTGFINSYREKENVCLNFLITLVVLTVLFWIGFHVTGVLLSAAIWLFIKLPFALILGDKIE